MGKSSNFLLFFSLILNFSMSVLNLVWKKRKKFTQNWRKALKKPQTNRFQNFLEKLKKNNLYGFVSFVPLLLFPRALVILESPAAKSQGYKTWWEEFQSNLTKLDCVLSEAVRSAYSHDLGPQQRTYRDWEGIMQEGLCRYIPPGDQTIACDTEPVICTEVSVTEGNSRRENK